MIIGKFSSASEDGYVGEIVTPTGSIGPVRIAPVAGKAIDYVVTEKRQHQGTAHQQIAQAVAAPSAIPIAPPKHPASPANAAAPPARADNRHRLPRTVKRRPQWCRRNALHLAGAWSRSYVEEALRLSALDQCKAE
jgi:hypothetical protein